ncbi:MAG TPA: dTDP-4-dehydrorhamnose 3,5-epimerase [Bacteroidales bacterium]|nr:dTDP-4-dehydrorhamnose 3,5-epimerase [Bacteroidales bacterium]
MKKIPTAIPDVFVIEPDVFEDNRGYFFETYNQQKYAELGLNDKFVQDNESLSAKNVLRGLHFQKPPYEQGKLVRVIRGGVLDVAVDIRKNSPFFGKWVSQELTEQNKLLMWIPPGFAHGFVTLFDCTVFSYKCTGFYNHASEQVLLWNDTDIGVNWMINNPVLSERDKSGMPLNKFCTPFIYK